MLFSSLPAEFQEEDVHPDDRACCGCSCYWTHHLGFGQIMKAISSSAALCLCAFLFSLSLNLSLFPELRGFFGGSLEWCAKVKKKKPHQHIKLWNSYWLWTCAASLSLTPRRCLRIVQLTSSHHDIAFMTTAKLFYRLSFITEERFLFTNQTHTNICWSYLCLCLILVQRKLNYHLEERHPYADIADYLRCCNSSP